VYKKSRKTTKGEEIGEKDEKWKQSKRNVERGKGYSLDYRKTLVPFLQLELLHLGSGFLAHVVVTKHIGNLCPRGVGRTCQTADSLIREVGKCKWIITAR
jgi:hypothetical protein